MFIQSRKIFYKDKIFSLLLIIKLFCSLIKSNSYLVSRESYLAKKIGARSQKNIQPKYTLITYNNPKYWILNFYFLHNILLVLIVLSFLSDILYTIY